MDIPFNERQKQNALFATALNHILISAKCQTFSITYRAKTDASIANKLSRFGETPNQILDLYGIRVVTPTWPDVERIANTIVQLYGEKPTEKEMTIRNGTLIFPSYRDYRKRDWEGVSPATSSGYLDAIHINRKMQTYIVEIQIMTDELFLKYCTAALDESHASFKKRQEKLPNTRTIIF